MRYLLLLLVLASCGLSTDSIRVGYCPTMESYVNQISGIEPVLFDSASLAITALQEGEVSAIIIGRKAYSHENTGFTQVLLRDSYTLVGLESAIVSIDDLDSILTCSFEEVDYPFGNVTVISTAQEDCQAFLIRWSQFSDHNLIIPEDNGEKIGWFRTPHLYSFDVDILGKILEN